MSLLAHIALDRLTPARLWAALDADTRLLSARALYQHDWGDTPTRREADLAIAVGMRFRDTMVRQLPVEKRALYLATSVAPSDNLSASLLLALHLEQRRAILAAFLDGLGLPHENGLIAEDHEVGAQAPGKLGSAAAALFERFDGAHVEVYLASLLAIDPTTWGGLAEVLRARAGSVAEKR
jgi:hypothetical protein